MLDCLEPLIKRWKRDNPYLTDSEIESIVDEGIKLAMSRAPHQIIHVLPDVYTSAQLIKYADQCKTKAKSVAQKIRPVGAIPVREEDMLPDEPVRNLKTSITDEEATLLASSPDLLEPEREVLFNLVKKYPQIWAFKDDEKGCLSEEIQPPVRIYTKPHSPWHYTPAPHTAQEEQEVCALIRKKIQEGTMEYCSGPYAGKHFFFRKPNNELRHIQNFQDLNAVTMRNVGEPPNPQYFVEKSSGRLVYSIIDALSGYDQIPLDKRDRDLTGMNTQLGLVRMTRLPQGWTNSVAVFQQSMRKVLSDLLPDPADVFVDDIVVLGPKVDQLEEGEDDALGRRWFIMKHLADLEKVFERLAKAKITFSAKKAQLCVFNVKILGQICNKEGRQVTDKFKSKISEFPRPANKTEVRGFLGAARCYRAYFEDFESMARPLTALTSPKAAFEWGEEEEKCFNSLKTAMCSAPVLSPFEPLPDTPLRLTTDASEKGCGAKLEVLRPDGYHPCRYESRSFNATESAYSAQKRELLSILHATKKFHPYLVGRKIILRCDNEIVVKWLKNVKAADLSVLDWIQQITQYDLEVEHISGKDNCLADMLSRHPVDEPRVSETVVVNAVYVNEYPKEYLDVVNYLKEGEIPETISEPSKVSEFKGKCGGYLLKNEQLLKLGKLPNDRPRVVVFNEDWKVDIMKEAHEGPFGGHRATKACHRKIKQYFYWPKMWEDVNLYCSTCESCQKFDPRRQKENLRAMAPQAVLGKIHMDLVHMPKGVGGFRYFIDARDDLSGFVYAEPLRTKATAGVVKFIMKFLAIFGVPEVIVADNGELDCELVKKKLASYGSKVRFTTPYHPASNGVVERGHSELVKALERSLGTSRFKLWPRYLQWACLADNCTVRSGTGLSPFRCMYGREANLSLQFEIPDLQERSLTRDDLIALRLDELCKLESDVDYAAERLRCARENAADYWNRRHRTRIKPIEVGDLVLRSNETLSSLPISKGEVHWSGPYRVVKSYGNGSYVVAELDGTESVERQHGNRLKPYLARSREHVGPEE